MEKPPYIENKLSAENLDSTVTHIANFERSWLTRASTNEVGEDLTVILV